MSITRTMLEDALVSAHNAGDTEAATVLAGEINKYSAKPQLSRTDKYINGLRDPIDAGAQLLNNVLPDSVVNAGNRFNNFVADNTGLVGRLPEGGINQQIKQQEAQYQANRQAQGESGFDGYRMIGNILNPANLVLASKIPQATQAGAKILTNIFGGAGLSVLGLPVADGNYFTEKAKQAAVGAVGGGLTPLFVSGIARAISPKASTNPNIQILRNEGINPTFGQTLGGVANRVEEKLQSLPIFGDMISMARGKADSQFQTAAFNRALKPIGQKLPEGLKGRDAIVYTENSLKQNYDDVLTKIGAISPDAQFGSKITNLESMVNKQVMPKAEKAKFASALNDIRQSIDRNGVITSDAYKALESSLGTDARKLASSTNIYEGKISPAVKQLQQELREMLKRQAGQYADELKATNSGWANFKRVQNAASKVGAEDGIFSPSQFQNAVRTLDKSKDKAAFARGSALGQDLSDAGKSVLGNKVPNSGTPERLLLGGAAVGSSFFDPTILGSLISGGALYTPAGQKLLNALVASRPNGAAQFAELVRQNGNYVLPASSSIGLGLLD